MSSVLNVERRSYSSQSTDGWAGLSLPQQLAANELGQFGYSLAFVRKNENEHVAVLTVDNRVATIGEDGEINTSPDIVVRK